MTLFDRVNQLRAQRNMTLEDVEQASGVARQTLYRGPRHRAVLAALAYGFQITVEELVAGTEAEEIW